MNKKSLILIIVILATIFVLIPFFIKKTAQRETIKITAPIENIAKDNTNQDSDNDGLKDWQEALYKTNSNNPDTDGDGTNDGEEIKQNRNPLVAGPDDKIKEGIIQKIGLLLGLPENADTIIQNNQETENFQKNTSNTTLSQEKTKEDNLLIKELRDYGNKVGYITKNYTPDPFKNTEAFENLIKDNHDAQAIENFRSVSVAYEELSKKLAVLKIPAKASYIEPNLANAYKNISIAMDIVLTKTSDNKSFINNLKLYNEDVLKLAESIHELSDLFKKNNIIYSPTEDGYIFTG